MNISYERIHNKVDVDLVIRKISDEWIPKNLNVDQKRARFLRPCCYYRWNLAVFLRPRDNVAIDRKKILWISKV